MRGILELFLILVYTVILYNRIMDDTGKTIEKMEFNESLTSVG